MENIKKINKNSKIAVLMGGLSNEREVSLRSGRKVFQALIELGYKDVTLIDVSRNIADVLVENKIEFVLNMLHGRYGEDGCIQGVLEFLNIPYSGCGVKASAVCMDKIMTKKVLSSANLPLIKSVNVNKENYRKKVEELNFPMIIKPANEGSSIGMTKIDSMDELDNAINRALECDKEILIEEYISGKELTVSVLNGKALSVTEMRPKNGFYDYKAKYTDGMTDHIIPAEIPEAAFTTALNYAERLHQALGCNTVSRTDMRYNGKDGVVVLEINTNPGMTPLSLVPEQFKYVGGSYEKLCQILVEEAKCRKISR